MLHKLITAALAALLSLPFCGAGELPELSKQDVLVFFKALPAKDLPDQLATQEARETYWEKFRFMSEDGALADGEGPEETTPKQEHSLFWSDFLDTYDQEISDEPVQSENSPHPYVNIYLFAGAKKGVQFGVLKSGAFIGGDEKVNPDKYYWFDANTSTLTPASLVLLPAYTADDLTANTLLFHGTQNLYYAVKKEKFHQSFHDGGMDVYIEDVGKTDVSYDWNGEAFVRNYTKPVYCIYNYGFANIMLGDTVPFSVPEYSTTVIESTEYETIFKLEKEDEDKPALIFHADKMDHILMIEVCSGAYCNPYGIYPGMPVADFQKVVDKINARLPEPPYVSYNDSDPEFVTIYTGFDEDFHYMVPKSQYKGNGKFAPGAKIARVVVENAVG